MANKLQLLLWGRAEPRAMLQQIYGAEERVNVLDLATHVTLLVCAHELSPYRHTLVLNGLEYQILNVIRRQ